MKKLLRSRRDTLGSLAGFPDPSQILSTKTGWASGRTARKSLIINDQILHPPPKSSGNVRFCTFTPPIPNLSAVIRALTPGATPRQRPPNRCTVLHCVAPCFAQKSFRSQVQHLHFPDRAGPVAWWYCRDAPAHQYVAEQMLKEFKF